jgi:hypothetical protein
VIPKLKWSNDSPEKTPPVNDGGYLVLLMGTFAIIVVRVVQAVGTVCHHLTTECDDNTQWLNNAKSPIIETI